MSIKTRPTRSQKEPVVQEKRVSVLNKHGEKLVGILHDAAGSKELVLVCHGFRSSKVVAWDDRIPMVNLADALAKQGIISAFRFDFAGNGESEGLFRFGNYHNEADDVHAVVEHFRGQDYVITAIVGHSKGWNAAILYGSKYRDVPILVNISGRFNLPQGIERGFGKDFLQRIQHDGFIDVRNKRGEFQYRVTEESLMECLTIDLRAASRAISPNCRVLTVHGSMDKVNPVEEAFEFDKFIPNHRLCIVEGAGHEYRKHRNELASVVLDFIKADHHGKLSNQQSRL